MDSLIVIIIVLGLIGLTYASIYNALVKLRQKVKEAWSGIDVQLKRRYDLIPNLIKTVKGYAKHEKETFEKVTAARTAAMNNQGSPAEQAKTENMLSGTLKSIFALSENYPDLKANENFLKLQSELTQTEDQIASSRRIYNQNVTDMNTKVESFPSNFIAGFHKFTKEEFFKMSEAESAEAAKAPEVNFS